MNYRKHPYYFSGWRFSGANDIDHTKAGRLYAQHEQALFDLLNELIAREMVDRYRVACI
jgi:hypothetical protein